MKRLICALVFVPTLLIGQAFSPFDLAFIGKPSTAADPKEYQTSVGFVNESGARQYQTAEGMVNEL